MCIQPESTSTRLPIATMMIDGVPVTSVRAFAISISTLTLSLSIHTYIHIRLLRRMTGRICTRLQILAEIRIKARA